MIANRCKPLAMSQALLGTCVLHTLEAKRAQELFLRPENNSGDISLLLLCVLHTSEAESAQELFLRPENNSGDMFSARVVCFAHFGSRKRPGIIFEARK